MALSKRGTRQNLAVENGLLRSKGKTRFMEQEENKKIKGDGKRPP
jgi:hypothetical protein